MLQVHGSSISSPPRIPSRPDCEAPFLSASTTGRSERPWEVNEKTVRRHWEVSKVRLMELIRQAWPSEDDVLEQLSGTVAGLRMETVGWFRK